MEQTFEKAQALWLKENFLDLKKENETLVEENDRLKYEVLKLKSKLRLNEEFLKQQKEVADGLFETNKNLLDVIDERK